MSDTLLSVIEKEFDGLFEPIMLAVDDPGWLARLLIALGIDPVDVDGAPLVNALSAVVDFKQQLSVLTANTSPSFEEITAVLNAASNLFNAVRSIDSANGMSRALEGIAEDFVQWLITNHLSYAHRRLYAFALLATLVEPGSAVTLTTPVVDGEDYLREPVAIDRIHPKRIIELLRDPIATLKAYYVNNLATVADANAMADKLFPRIGQLLIELGVACSYGLADRDRPALGDAAPYVDHALTIYLQKKSAGAPADIGFTLAFSSADRGDLGLVVTPFGAVTMTLEAGKWKFELDFTADVEVLAYGKNGLVLVAGASTTEIGGVCSATLAVPDTGPAFVLGSPTGSRLEIGGAEIKVMTSLSEAQKTLALFADVAKSTIVIARGAGDSFINSLLPAEGLKAEFDLGLAWSNTGGFSLCGDTGLEATLPIGLSIGGVSVPTIHLSLQAHDASLVAEVSTTLGVSIGPVNAAIERVGLVAAVTFPETGGNVGVANLDFRFKPPNGIALVIDAKTVVGGGYLSFHEQKAEYSGILELQIAERIAVKAIGLLTTRLPDGAQGAPYSLLILITTEGFTPVPLGLGFTLTGIGGLLVINRTFAEDALRAGLKNHTLDSVMFPHDPLRNAPQIISNLNSVFPPADGHHLFGPMVQIAWGTPPLITTELGLVLEFGARRRLLVLGQVAAILPRPDHELLRLQLDAIGVLDFDQGTAALDATLYDSRLLKRFALTGDMAMRLQWERSRTFALAVGGLHPAFRPPPNFPKLARLALDLSKGDNPRLRCEAYFALTSNTVQFGARAELYASAIGFSIHGEIGFDVLIERDPFHFLADFYAQVQLKRGSTNLFKVRVEGTLEGPRPLHLKGKAMFEILWWDVTVRFNATLVGGVTPLLAELIDVLPLLREALVHPGNWRGQLPAGQRPMVTLRATPGAATDVCLHPLDTLTVTQSVVPLNLEISRFGSAVPAGARSFTISSVSLGSLGGQHQTPPSVTDFFARAQFFEMSDAEKLSSPSFEPMVAGFSIASDAFVFSENPDDWLDVDKIAYDTITVDTETNELRRSLRRSDSNAPYVLSRELLGKQARFGAAGSSALRRTGSAKYRTTRGAKYELVPEGWIIVATADLSAQAAPGIAAGKPVTYSEAVQALRQLQQEDPAKAAGLTMLRLSEWPFSEVPRG